MELAYGEITDVLDIKHFPSESRAYTLPPGIYEVSDFIRTLEYLLPDFVKVNVTIDDIRLESDLIFNQTLIFTEKSFFYRLIGFTQSHAGPLNDVEDFVQMIPGR